MFENSPNAKYILIGIAAVAVAIVIGIVIGCVVTTNGENAETRMAFVSETGNTTVYTTDAVITMYDSGEPVIIDGVKYNKTNIVISDAYYGLDAIIPAVYLAHSTRCPDTEFWMDTKWLMHLGLTNDTILP